MKDKDLFAKHAALIHAPLDQNPNYSEFVNQLIAETDDGLESIHFNEALDAAFDQIKQAMLSQAKYGASTYSIGYMSIWQNMTEYIESTYGDTVDVPEYGKVQSYLVKRVNATFKELGLKVTNYQNDIVSVSWSDYM